jgi:ketosteroid isomerase-like protein
MVSGDLAVVRLTWTLKVRNEGASGDVTSEEVGLDVFRRQPDGRWKIIRYTAFEAP